MISVVTGTLNRKHLLPLIIENTVEADDRIELVLVDGGSEDGTVDYIKGLNHNRIILVEIGERSPYPHYMNLGIRNSTNEYICQWNDDVLLLNTWQDVIDEIDDSMMYIFNWKYGNISDMKDEGWLAGNNHSNNWFLLNTKSASGGDIVLNYGMYHKDVFRNIGMYSNEFQYYYADGDMAERCWYFHVKIKTLRDIKVLALQEEKKAIHYSNDHGIFLKKRHEYQENILTNVEYLK